MNKLAPVTAHRASVGASVGALGFGFVGLVGLAGLVGMVGSLTSCSTPDDSHITLVGGDMGPNEDLYKQYVDPYLARRCGTLDCHGQVGRPLRIYAQLGLRMADAGIVDPIDVTGFRGEPTTDAERAANYEAVMGLQPEVMAQVTADHGANPLRLLLLLKPLDAIPHKGGVQMFLGGSGTGVTSDTGYDCVVDWLQGGVDPVTGGVSGTLINNCTAAAAIP